MKMGYGSDALKTRYGLHALPLVMMAAFLTACGGDGATGGGGLSSPPASEPPAPAPIDGPTAEGAYLGRTSRGPDLRLIVLENDVAWGLYERNGVLVGFFQGAGFSEDGRFTAADVREFDLVDGVTRAGTMRGTYVAGFSIEGTMIPTVGAQFSFDATTSVAGYDYRVPATMSRIQGTWQGFYGDRADSGSMDVSSSGDVTAVTQLGCRYTGTVAPRASGRNVYDVRFDFGAPPCTLAGLAATGIAVIVEMPGGTRQLLWAATDASRELGITFAGTQ